MDDLQRQPKDSDRAKISARINLAHDSGRITTADRDIRLGNVKSAQSMAELDLMSRELDQLDASLPARPYSTFQPPASDDDDDDDTASAAAAPGAPRSRAAGITVVIAVAVLVAAVAIFLNYQGSGASTKTPTTPGTAGGPPSAVPSSPGVAPGGGTVGGGAAYSLTGNGIRSFLQTYAKRFGTTEVVDLTMYGDYVVVMVPVPGKARESGWLFRPASGWTSFGGVRAVFPGSQPVDTNRLAIPALVRNIARARATLNVEAPQQTYVIVRYIRGVDQAPSVDIHVSNQFQESGYLATTLEGRVQRAYPYSS